MGLGLLLLAIILLCQQLPGLSSPAGRRAKQENQCFEVVLSWSLGCETSGLGGLQWAGVLRKERPPLLQGPLSSSPCPVSPRELYPLLWPGPPCTPSGAVSGDPTCCLHGGHGWPQGVAPGREPEDEAGKRPLCSSRRQWPTT